MSNFSLSVSQWAEKQKAGIDNAVRSVVIGLGTNLVYRSPVGNRELWAENIARAAKGLPPAPKGYVGGRFRANWQYGFNACPSSELYEHSPPAHGYPGAQDVVDGVAGKVKIAAVAGIHYLTNNLPYAERLEDGSSTQAPAGMVSLAVVEFEGMLRAAVKK